MHSSRMRTGGGGVSAQGSVSPRLVCPGGVVSAQGGGVCPGGMSGVCPKGVSGQGDGVCPGGGWVVSAEGGCLPRGVGISTCTEAGTPAVDRQTRVKT